METKFSVKAHHDYLDSLIANYPMNDYKRLPKKQKKPLKRVLWDAFLYTVCSIITIATVLLMACADSIMGCI